MTLPNGWSAIEQPELATGLLAELARELPAKHILRGRQLEAIARSESSDDVLFASVGGDAPFFLVHLTWNVETDPNWPHTVAYGSIAEFAEAWAADNVT
jgi:hypothetical protein